jgi:hypothetical protein
MMQHDNHKEFYPQEFVEEDLCVITDYEGPYVFMRWYVEDPDPSAAWYLTELGTSPKNRFVHAGKIYMVSDYCWVGVN